MNGNRGGLGDVTLIALFAVAVGVYIGADYYHLPAAARVRHAQHPVLRSSGSVGLACGIAGTVLFLVNLSYLLRKRLVSLQWLGTLRAWMGIHLVSGLLGALSYSGVPVVIPRREPEEECVTQVPVTIAR